MKKLIIIFLLISGVCYSQLETGKQLGWKWGLKKSAIYQYALDFDGSTEYLSCTPALRLTGEYSLVDNFSDGNYDGWTVSSGAYSVVDSVPLSGGTKSLKCTTAGIISIPCNQAYGSWEFDWYKGADGNTFNNIFIGDNRTGAFATNTGYDLFISNTEYIRLNIYNGNDGAYFITATNYFIINTWYHLKITRNTNGQFYVYIKGGTFGSDYILVSVTGGSGTNPVTDNTYTSSNYFVLDLDANDMIANIVCQQGEGSLDLNSYERIYHSSNRTFETKAGYSWADNGTHSIDTTSTDKRTGSYSGKLISTGAGDSTTNFVSLPAVNFDTLKQDVNGVYEKYTLEGWARGEGIIGDTINQNVSFYADTYWTKADGTVTIADGVGHFTASTLYKSIYRTNLLTVGKTYQVTYTVLNYSAGSVTCQVGGTFGTTRTANGTYTDYVVCGATTTFQMISRSGSNTLDIDDVQVKEITLPSLTLRIGNQTKTITGISCVPATFTKFVFNFQSNSLVSNQDIKMWVNQADTVYVDDVSLTKGWDVAINMYAYPTSTSFKAILGNSQGSTSGYDFGTQTGYIIRSEYISTSDNMFNLDPSGTQLLNIYSLYGSTVNRIDSSFNYRSGIRTIGKIISAVGKIITTNTFYVGSRLNADSKFLGQIGHIQITKFTDISQSNVNSTTLTTAYNRGKLISGEWTGGTPIEVAFYDWKGADATEMLRDKSGTGNNLTGTNIDLNDRIKVKGKFK